MRPILFVDPDKHARELGSAYLEPAPVLEARHSAEALALLSSHDPRLLISEILIGGEDGLALCRRVKAERPHLPIIVTSFLLAEDRARSSGADAFLPKPLTKEALLRAITRVAGGLGSFELPPASAD